jgi:hypothetical protein
MSLVSSITCSNQIAMSIYDFNREMDCPYQQTAVGEALGNEVKTTSSLYSLGMNNTRFVA